MCLGGRREDGGRVRRGDHLPSHRYSRNTSTRGTAPTEHPLNAGRKCPTSKKQAFWRSKMGRKDASTIKLPVDQYRKQIGKQDYKKTKPILRATKLKAEAKKTAIGIKNSSVSALQERLEGKCFTELHHGSKTPGRSTCFGSQETS
ncbi:triple QxxK/R motif-containing protein isoform 2-T2 [Megaptera novaeangliae]